MNGRSVHGDQPTGGRKTSSTEGRREKAGHPPPVHDSVRTAWAADPVGFVSDQLGAGPWSKQIEIIEAIRDHSRVAVRSCNGSGKSYVAAYVVLWWLMCHTDSVVITTAPTGHQVKDILWREIRGTTWRKFVPQNEALEQLSFPKGLRPIYFRWFHEALDTP